MSFTAAQKHSTTAEIRRFACCFLNMDNVQSVKWEVAASQFDLTVKPASFRTVTQRALKKTVSAKDNGESIESVCSEQELKRFACCFLHSENIQSVNWEVAAAQFDQKVKVASFRTVTQRAVKKLEAIDQAGGVKPEKSSPSKKRQAIDGGDEVVTKKTKRTPKASQKINEESGGKIGEASTGEAPTVAASESDGSCEKQGNHGKYNSMFVGISNERLVSPACEELAPVEGEAEDGDDIVDTFN